MTTATPLTQSQTTAINQDVPVTVAGLEHVIGDFKGTSLDDRIRHLIEDIIHYCGWVEVVCRIDDGAIHCYLSISGRIDDLSPNLQGILYQVLFFGVLGLHSWE